MSLVARFANYRSWLPLILLFAGLTVFHIHLENYYSNVVSNINSTTPLNAGPRMPKPVYEDPSVAARRKAATAEGVAAKIAEEEEGMRNGEPYVEGKPWLSKRHLMHYPENAYLNVSSGTKYILHWNEAYGTREYGFPHGQKRFIDYNCKVQNCITTDNRKMFDNVNKFDAIVFHQRSMSKGDMPNQKERRPEQRYVHWMMEAPQNLYGWNPNLWIDFFNWTMTYRRDSTFYHPYGKIEIRKPHPQKKEKLDALIELFGKNNKHKAKGKTKKIAWFVSNCHAPSGRREYVQKLQQYIPVDIYGGCGPLKCSQRQGDQCWDMVEKDYKFYLSFENSLCLDYTTEKFWVPMNRTVIPVTLGNEFNYQDTAPYHSYISVVPEYKDPKALADYLHYLDTNDDKYAEYFWWKSFYHNYGNPDERAQGFCDLCEALHMENLPREHITKLREWWVTEAKCQNVFRL